MDAGAPEVTTHLVPDDRRDDLAATLARLGLVTAEPVSASARLLDSFDARLADAGLAMIATSVDHDSHGRTHRSVRVTVTDSRRGVVAVDLSAPPRWPDDLPAGPLRTRLAAELDVRALVPIVELVGRTRTWRQLDEHDRSVVEVVEWSDVTTWPGDLAVPAERSEAIDASSCPSSFVEVRSARGEDAAAARIRTLLAEAGADGTVGSAPAVLADLAGIDLRGRTSRFDLALDRSMPALGGYRVVLDGLLEVVRVNRSGAAAAVDPEFLHDLRVAVRRTRSVLRHGRRVLPDEVRGRARDGFGRLGTLTGHARDLDVQVLDWDELTAGFDDRTMSALGPVRTHLAAEREAAHEAVRAGLADAATDELLEWWQSWLDAPVAMPDELHRRARRPLAPVVARELQRAQRRLLRDARLIDDASPAEHLHQLRKDAKALRYLFECFAPILPGRPRKRFVRRLKSFQDLLGTHQDAEVHAHLLTDVARELAEQGVDGRSVGADTLVAIGRLVEVHDRRRAAMRARFADEFAAYDDPTTHEAFDAVIDELRS